MTPLREKPRFSLLRACAVSNSGELAYTSSYGYYWSSSPYYGGDNNAGSLGFYSGYVRPLSDSYRASGFSVRCVQGK